MIRPRLICFVAAMAVILSSNHVQADNYVPMISSATGKEIARMFRTNGGPVSKEQAAKDKRDCLLDPREISDSEAKRLSALGRTNREAAEIESAKVVAPCVAKKGWRTEVANAGERSAIERSTIAAMDVELDRIASTLPRPMDEFSDLVRVKRDKTTAIFTVRVRSAEQVAADEMRRFASNDQRAAEVMQKSLMKQSLCKPDRSAFLKDGFSVVWEVFDNRGLVWRTSIKADDCDR